MRPNGMATQSALKELTFSVQVEDEEEQDAIVETLPIFSIIIIIVVVVAHGIAYAILELTHS